MQWLSVRISNHQPDNTNTPTRRSFQQQYGRWVNPDGCICCGRNCSDLYQEKEDPVQNLRASGVRARVCGLHNSFPFSNQFEHSFSFSKGVVGKWDNDPSPRNTGQAKKRPCNVQQRNMQHATSNCIK